MSPAKTKKTVGVIGLGIMGGSFSRNLVAAGWRVVGFDIDAGKRKELAKAGVEIVGQRQGGRRGGARSSSPACRSPRR